MRRLWRVAALLAVFACVAAAEDEAAAKVAVVGKGLPAALNAAALRDELGAEAEVTVITRHAQFGGKQTSGSNRYGHIQEPVCFTRGSKLHKLAEEVELPAATEHPFQKFAVFDGHATRFVFENLQDVANSDRYSDDWPKLRAVIELCESKRASLHKLFDEDPEFCRWNTSQFVRATQLDDLAFRSVADVLAQHGISATSNIATEIVGVLTSELFNQGLEVNGVAGCDAILQLFGANQVCYDMAGFEERIFERKHITLLPNTRAFSLRSEFGKINIGVNRTRVVGPFDAVVVTDVTELNELFFTAEQEPMEDYRQWMEFVERYEYVVEGRWQTEYFEVDEPGAPLLAVPENVAAGFVSIRRLVRGTGPKVPSVFLLKTELPYQTVARQDMFGRRSQLLASLQQSPALPDLNPVHMRDGWGINPFPVSGHPMYTATQLQWLSFSPEFLSVAAQNAARTLVRVQKLGAHATTTTTNQCGGDLPPPVVIEKRKTKRFFMPDPGEHLAEKLRQMATPKMARTNNPETPQQEQQLGQSAQDVKRDEL